MGMNNNMESFKDIMSRRYDSTNLVSLSRQKLDYVFQGNEGVERYMERVVTEALYAEEI